MYASVPLFNRVVQILNDTTHIWFCRETVAYSDGSVPGQLRVGAMVFPTIERGGDRVNLKIGVYVMEHSTKRTGRKVKCLRPVESKLDTLLIHDAFNDSSLELEGCIAPGLAKKPPPGMGILSSAAAMDQIWALLGGWQAGKTVTLHITSNVPGEARTKETWERLK